MQAQFRVRRALETSAEKRQFLHMKSDFASVHEEQTYSAAEIRGKDITARMTMIFRTKMSGPRVAR
jgi:hypothetical protein